VVGYHGVAVQLDQSLTGAINHGPIHVTPPHVKDLNLAYSCIQRDALCFDNVATDLSRRLKTSILLSASIIPTAGLSIPPDLHQVLVYRAVTLFKTLKIE